MHSTKVADQYSILSRLVKVQSAADAYAQYRGRMEPFFYEMLGVGMLTAPQIQVIHSVEQNPNTVVTSATGVGKTYLMAGLAAALFTCYERCGIYIAAAPPESNLRSLAWGELIRFVSRAPKLFENTIIKDLMISKVEHVAAAKHSRRESRSRIAGLTIPSQGRDDKMETSFSGKHHEDLLAFLYDEADGVPDPCYRGADGCLSGSGLMRQVFFLNPKTRDGEPYRRIEEGRAHHIVLSAFDHPNVQMGTMLIPGAVTRDKTIERIQQWTSPILPNEERDEFCYQLPDYLIGTTTQSPNGDMYPRLEPGWRRVEDNQFFTKVLGTYPPVSAGYLINPYKLAEAVARWQMYRQAHGGPPDDVLPHMMFDVADNPTGDASSVVFTYGDYVDMPVRLIGMDSLDYAHKAADLYHERKVVMCYVDAIGVGASVPHIMIRDRDCKAVVSHKGSRAAPWTIEGKFGTVRDYCLYMMCRWINTSSTAMIPNDDRLLKGLKALTATTTDALRVIDKPALRRKLGFSPDAMDALSMKFAQPRFSSGAI